MAYPDQSPSSIRRGQPAHVQLRELIFAGRANLSGLRLSHSADPAAERSRGGVGSRVHFLDPQWRPLIAISASRTRSSATSWPDLSMPVSRRPARNRRRRHRKLPRPLFHGDEHRSGHRLRGGARRCASLIVRDRLGNAYVRTVAYLTGLAVFLLVARASGASRTISRCR